MKTEDGEETYGFVKNEYVWASSESTAIAKAKQKVREKIAKKPGIGVPADTALDLAVDEVERGFSAWKLAADESFIFFDPDTDQGSTD